MGGRFFATIIALVAVAAAGCPTVDLTDELPEPGSCRLDRTYYEEVLWPEYLAPSCLSAPGCHGQSNEPRSALRLSTREPVDHDANYDVVVRFLSCREEERSPLLTKPLAGIDPHGGGDLFADPSAERTLFLDWFSQ
jgi:hypothetical protein